MGICLNGINKNDYDLKTIQLEKNRQMKRSSSKDIYNQTDYNSGITNNDQNNNSPLKLYLSKKIIKLIVKQSKCLMEGKEYIINSLGLLDSKNKDGLTIFGDTNVSYILKQIYIY